MSNSNGFSRKTKQSISKYIRISLVFVLILSMFSNIGVRVSNAEEVIEIDSVTDLKAMGVTGSYKLTADIDLLNSSWDTKEFNGTLDGNGHTIKNALITNESGTNSSKGSALFYSTQGVTIKNLVLENINVTIDTAYTQYPNGNAGTLLSSVNAAAVTTPTSLTNITVKNSTIKNNRGLSGGVAGLIDTRNVTLSNIVVDGVTIDSKPGSGGGPVGGAFAYVKSSYSGAHAYSNIIANTNLSSTTGSIGGAFGTISAGGNTPTVSNIATFGTINGASVLGGVVGAYSGLSYYPTFKNLTSDMEINGVGDSTKIGGILGTADGSSSMTGRQVTIDSALFTGTITQTGPSTAWGYMYTGGIGGNVYTSKIMNSASLAKELNSPNNNTYLYNVTGQDVDTVAGKKIFASDSIQGNFKQQSTDVGVITDAEKTKASTYADKLGWDMNLTWGIKEGISTPYLLVLNELYPNYYSELDPDSPKLPALAAPTNLSTSEVTHDIVKLTWDAVEGATEYDVVRDGNVIDTVNTNSYTNAPVKADTTYTYKIVAKDPANGRSATSDELEVKTELEPLGTPNDFNSSDLTPTSVKLTWSPIEEATGYKIERNGEVIATVDTTSFEDTQLEQNTNYKYTLYAIDDERTSEPTSTEVRTPFKDLKAPAGLTTSNIKTNSLTLSWDAVEEADKYRIYIDGKELGIVDGTSIEINDLSPNTKYKFEVQAMDTVNDRESTLSQIEELTAIDPLEAPQNLKADTVTNNSVLLTWDEVQGATAYKIQRNGVTIATVYTNTYENTRLAADTDYEYKVTAINEDDGRKSETSIINVTTKLNPLASPTNVVATNVDNSSAILHWDSVNGAKSYNIIKDGQVIDSTTGNSYYVGNLKGDTVYTYSISAVDPDSERTSGATPVTFKTVKDPLGVPNNLKANVTSSSVNLTWDKVEGATTYKILRDGEIVDETNKTTLTDSFVDANTAYEYSVIAFDSANNRQSQPAIVYVKTTLGTPETFEAVNVTSHSLDLIWGSVRGATSYQIERDGVLLTEVSGLTFTDNTVLKNTTYLYKLYAIDSTTGQKSLYKELKVTTLAEAPATPKNFMLYGSPSSTNVVLNWDAVEDATKYTLKRNGEIVYEGTEHAFKETETLPDGETYIYELTATNAVGTSDPARLAVEIESVTPQAPSNLKVTKVTNTSIAISFDKVVGADGYMVTIDGEDLETITGTSYTFTGLQEDTIYTIAISSVNEKGTSKDPSVLEVRTTLAPPEKVENFKSTRVTPTTVNLQWNKLDTATEYEVYRDGNVLVYSGALSTFQDTTVSPETNYSYTVYGKNQYGKSEEGTTIVVTTPKETQPITTTQPDTSAYNVTFDFKVVEGVSTYKVSRNPEWTYESNGDGTFNVNSVNSVTGEVKTLGTVEETEDGFLPFYENLNGSEGNNLKYNIVGVIKSGENGEEVTTDPIEVEVNVPQPSETPSNESTLSSLTVKDGELKPSFDSSKSDYNVEIKDSVKQITLSPSATSKNATITVDGIPVSSGGTSPIISTTELPKTVVIEVLAEDRVTKTTYTLTLVKASETENGGTTEPSNPDDGNNGEVPEPSNPSDGNGTDEGETTNPDENGEVTEPTEPANPDNGNNGEETEPSNPSDENGTDEGEEVKPTEPSKNENNENNSNESSSSKDETDSDKSDSKPSAVKEEGTNDNQSTGKENSSSSDKESSKSDEQNKSNASKNELPDTANYFYNYMVIGLLLVVAGIVFFFVSKRRKEAQ